MTSERASSRAYLAELVREMMRFRPLGSDFYAWMEVARIIHEDLRAQTPNDTKDNKQ